MKKSEWFVPSLPEYEHIKLNREGVSKLYSQRRKRMKPTSIALLPETIADLMFLAMKRGVPYQVLMRSFVLKGLRDSIVEDRNENPPYRARPRTKKK